MSTNVREGSYDGNRRIFARHCIMDVSSLKKHKQPALIAETAELSCYGETPITGQPTWRRREWRENCAPIEHVSRQQADGKRRSSGRKYRGIDELMVPRGSDVTRRKRTGNETSKRGNSRDRNRVSSRQ